MQLGPDAQAVLLLTARFGGEGAGGAKPLGPREWGDFAEWLKRLGSRPSELINGRSASLLADWDHPKIDRERLGKLLQRGNAMALALEKWERAGLWVLTRADEHYPSRLKRRLGKSAPPVFFGCGNRSLLDSGGIAVVGSRNASDADLEFCRRIGAQAAAEGYTVVSGGARGVDETAMLAALEREGTVMGVVADSLLRAITRPQYRSSLRSGDLVLISPYYPDARFQVGNAMGRNKYIYCLADAGVVVTCEKESGGTYAGAKETLKNHWVPVWTRQSERSADGVEALEAIGAVRLPKAEFLIASLFKPKHAATQPAQAAKDQLSPVEELETVRVDSEDPGPYVAAPPKASEDPAGLLFKAFLDQLQFVLQSAPMRPEEIAEQLQIKPVQAKAWLQKTEQAGLIEKAGKKPVTYNWVAQRRFVFEAD